MMVEAAVTELKLKLPVLPEIGVVLGSGLGSFADEVEDPTVIPYADIPHWPASTAVGHAGKLVVGRVAGRTVAVLAGRAHLYEGYTPAESTFAMRVLGSLGVHSVILTNAAGGLHPSLDPGDIMVIDRHWKLLRPGDWKSLDRPTRRYSESGLDKLRRLAPAPHFGGYAALTGPCYETPAEIRALAACGVDAVGMSTAVEAEVGAALGLEVLAFSCITNEAAGLSGDALSHKDVEANAKLGIDGMRRVIDCVLNPRADP